MNVAHLKSRIASSITILLLLSTALAQSSTSEKAHAASSQSAASTLASLPEADTVIYLSPQRILNEAAPKVTPPADLAKLRATFADLKQTIGIDPASIEYFAIAVRFQKPAADLSFVPPDLLAVLSGDFSADSMLTLISLYLQEQARTETYRSKTITLMKIDPIVQAAVKTPMLKAFTELGAVALNSNTLAIGNTAYLKAAVDASAGEGRINPTSLNSLLRNPNTLISASGSPLTAFIKSFGLLGTQAAPRESSCQTRFGDFYAAVTVEGTNFSLRGAMNTDNPETAKIIHGLISSLLEPAINSVPDKEAQSILKSIKMSPRENEIVLEADVSHETIAKFIREQTQPKPAATSTNPTPKPKPKARVRRKKV